MKTIKILLLLCLVMALAGCASKAPLTPIAVSAPPQPLAQYPLNPLPPVVYQGYMELRVASVESAARRAGRMAVEQGGYVSASNTWVVDGQSVTTLDLSVPYERYEALRSAVLGLGDLVSENITSRPLDPPGSRYAPAYTSLRLHLRPDEWAWQDSPSGDSWNPGRTLAQAWAVFVSVFGFLADVVIWLLVVVGPFALLAAGAYWLIRRGRKPAA